MSFDATFVAFLALLIFIGLLVYLKVPAMIAGQLDQRSQAIAKDLSEARRLREEAERLLAEYQAKMDAAQHEAATLVASAKEQAEMLAQESSAKLKQAIADRQRQAEERIALAEAQAQAQVRAAATDAAIQAAEKLLRERMSDSVQSKLVAQGAAELAKTFA